MAMPVSVRDKADGNRQRRYQYTATLSPTNAHGATGCTRDIAFNKPHVTANNY
jgi:hypothetical protein